MTTQDDENGATIPKKCWLAKLFTPLTFGLFMVGCLGVLYFATSLGVWWSLGEKFPEVVGDLRTLEFYLQAPIVRCVVLLVLWASSILVLPRYPRAGARILCLAMFLSATCWWFEIRAQQWQFMTFDINTGHDRFYITWWLPSSLLPWPEEEGRQMAIAGGVAVAAAVLFLVCERSFRRNGARAIACCDDEVKETP